MLETRPQSGTFIRMPDREEFDRLIELREMLEPYAAARAARFATARQLKRLERACEHIGQLCVDLRHWTGDGLPGRYPERSMRAENAFHGTILEAARAPEAAHLLENVRIWTYVGSLMNRWPRADLVRALADAVAGHRAIFEAVRRGDSEDARRCMRRHVALPRNWKLPEHLWLAFPDAVPSRDQQTSNETR